MERDILKSNLIKDYVEEYDHFDYNKFISDAVDRIANINKINGNYSAKILYTKGYYRPCIYLTIKIDGKIEYSNEMSCMLLELDRVASNKEDSTSIDISACDNLVIGKTLFSDYSIGKSFDHLANLANLSDSTETILTILYLASFIYMAKNNVGVIDLHHKTDNE